MHKRYFYKPPSLNFLNDPPKTEPVINSTIDLKTEDNFKSNIVKDDKKEEIVNEKMDLKLIEELFESKLEKIQKVLIDYKIPLEVLNDKVNDLSNKNEELLKRKRKKDEEKNKELKALKKETKKKKNDTKDIILKNDNVSADCISNSEQS